MPKFSENEKKIIREKLFTEGERLFTLHGIKKVTVDDLVNAAGIAKGSFYAFYTNKEHLYMDISESLQKQVWNDMDDFLEKNRNLNTKEITKRVLMYSFSQLYKYPMLLQNTGETTDYLFRKLPKEVIEAHTREDGNELLRLQKYGVRFRYGIEVTAKVLQALALSFFQLESEKNDSNHKVFEIMVNGIVNEIVGDEND